MSKNIITEAIADAEDLKQSTVESIKEELMELITPQIKKSLSNIAEGKSLLGNKKSKLIKESSEDEDEYTDPDDEDMSDDEDSEEKHSKHSEDDADEDFMPEDEGGEDAAPEATEDDEEPLDSDDLTDLDTENDIDDGEDVDQTEDEADKESGDEEQSMHSEDEYNDDDFDDEFDDDIEVIPDEGEGESFEDSGDSEDDGEDFGDEEDGEEAPKTHHFSKHKHHDDGDGDEDDDFEEDEEDNLEEEFEIVEDEEPLTESFKDKKIKRLEAGLKQVQNEMAQVNLFQNKMRMVRKLVKENFAGAEKKIVTRILSEFDKATTIQEAKSVYTRMVNISNKKKKTIEEAKKATSASRKNIQGVKRTKQIVQEGLRRSHNERNMLGDAPRRVVNNGNISEEQINEGFADMRHLAGIKILTESKKVEVKKNNSSDKNTTKTKR